MIDAQVGAPTCAQAFSVAGCAQALRPAGYAASGTALLTPATSRVALYLVCSQGRALEQCEASDPSRGAIVAVSPRSSVDRPAVLPIRCCSQLVVQRSDQGDCSGSAIAIACLKQRGASRMSLANARSAFVRTRAISAARSPTAKGSKGSLAVIRGRDSDGFALPHRRKAHPLKHPGLLLRRQGVPVGFRLPLSGSPLMPGKPRVFPGARQAHSQAALG